MLFSASWTVMCKGASLGHLMRLSCVSDLMYRLLDFPHNMMAELGIRQSHFTISKLRDVLVNSRIIFLQTLLLR